MYVYVLQMRSRNFTPNLNLFTDFGTLVHICFAKWFLFL